MADHAAKPCPSCGYCPTCGHRPPYRVVPFVPWWYSQPPWQPTYPWTLVGTGTTYEITSGSGETTTSYQVNNG